MSGFGLAVLRLGLAVTFIAHGALMLFGIGGGPAAGPGGIAASAAFYSSLQLEPATLLAILAGLTQLLGGGLLALGLLTRWAALALAIYVGVGIWKVHLHAGFFMNWMGAANLREGLEYSLVLAAALVCLILSGGGAASLDGRRPNRQAAQAAARARIRAAG